MRAAHLHETIVEVLLLLTEEFVIPMADSEEDISDTDHEQLPVPSPKRAKVIDGQQSSIKKLANTALCEQYEPPKEVLESARKATMAYNRAHSSKHNA